MRGLSLVEVLVSVFILGILVIGILNVMDLGSENYHINAGSLELQRQAFQALDWMINELREADITSITPLDADSDQIVFDAPGGDSGIQYYRDINDANGDGSIDQVIREYPPGTRKVLANRITRLKFTHSSPFLDINISTAQTVRQKQLSFALKERVMLRNE
jgi:hypothetical protein